MQSDKVKSVNRLSEADIGKLSSCQKFLWKDAIGQEAADALDILKDTVKIYDSTTRKPDKISRKDKSRSKSLKIGKSKIHEQKQQKFDEKILSEE